MTGIAEIMPFSFQSECLGILRYVRESAKKTALVIMASGLGKTITAAFHVRERFSICRESRCLFLCHQNDILEQAQGEFLKVIGPNVRYGFFHGFEKTADAQIVFASFQTMRRNLNQFDPGEFDIIVVDETHHGMADTFLKVIQHFKPDFLLGITATPDRGDERDIRDIYGKEVYNLSLVEALARGLLSPVEYKLMTDEISLKEVLETPNGRVSIAHLNRTVFVPKRDTEIASIITRHMSEVANPKVIVFCSSVKHCERMAKAIPGAVPIHSKLQRNDRRTRLELFRQGVFQVVVTVDMFNEALDIPQANIIVFLRSTASKTIYFQQLGRGLRPHEDKSKVTILDFVGNCERISFVYELWQEIRKKRKGFNRFAGLEEDGTSLDSWEPFSLNVDTVEFKERIVPLVEFIGRLRAEFYPTWQEASLAVKKLGGDIQTQEAYKLNYAKDPRLSSNPNRSYSDFPGWVKFLGGVEVDRYETYTEASAATQKLGIKTFEEYMKRYKEDPKLPAAPSVYYNDFIDWKAFLGKPGGNRYKTCAEASAAAKTLGCKSQGDYNRLRKSDPRLPGCPNECYVDFPGWKAFLDTEFYSLEEATSVVRKLGIRNSVEYASRHASDPKLPGNPRTFYEGFPGWEEFFDTVRYPTWAEASDVVKRLGIKTFADYGKRRSEDAKLPGNPVHYYKDFPGAMKFFGKTEPYATLAEASAAAIKLGIKSSSEYYKPSRRTLDPRLPNRPHKHKDWVSWDKFLGRE